MAKKVYIGVNNVARKVKKMYVGVNGVARRAKSGHIGVDGVARKFFAGGTPLSTLSIGQEVQIKENGVLTTYFVVQQGRPNYTYEDGLGYDVSCDGTWLLRKQVITSMQFHSAIQNADYTTSLIHTYLNGEFLTYFSPTVQSGIKQVKIPYVMAGHEDTILANENGLPTRAFILSMTEVGLHGPAGAGMLLQYFTYADDSQSNKARIAYTSGGTAVKYYSRSTSDSNRAYIVTSTGDGSYSAATSSNYVRPCIILPSDFAIEELIA